ncbi:MAG: hypothetical protein Kow0091_30300 [Geminocystis sp.]
MSKIEEVKAQIRQGNLEEAMAIAISEAMKIEIMTANINGDDSTACHSLIDLLENEIEHQLGDKSLENIHFEELENAHNHILQNVQSLQQMFVILKKNYQELS